jgi:hypothetical protein
MDAATKDFNVSGSLANLMNHYVFWVKVLTFVSALYPPRLKPDNQPAGLLPSMFNFFDPDLIKQGIFSVPSGFNGF